MPSLRATQKRQQRDAHYERRRTSLVSNEPDEMTTHAQTE
jgi:hypothetical protein